MDSGDNGDTRLLNSPKQLLSFLTETGDLLTSCTGLKHTESKGKKKNQDKLLTFQLSILNLIHLTFFVKYVLVYLHFYTYKTNKTKSNTEYTTHIRDCESPQKPTCYLLQQGNSRVCLKWGQHFLKIYKARCLPTRQPTHATAETVCSPTHTKQNYVISRVKHVVRTVTNLISL